VEQATAEAYTDAGIEKYQYVAVEDERTSDICQGLDGKIFLLSEAEVGVNFPPPTLTAEAQLFQFSNFKNLYNFP
jgi:Phage Mu protein F like protein.